MDEKEGLGLGGCGGEGGGGGLGGDDTSRQGARKTG